MTSADWNAADYERNSRAQQLWGQQAIARLGLRPTERLLDVGCGDGKLTAEIATLLPRGFAMGIDSSPDMIAVASQRYPRDRHANLEFCLCDAQSISFEEEYDVVYSNSALHWVADHPAALRGIARSLKPEGRVYLAFGARGTAPGIRAVFDDLIARPEWASSFQGFAFPLTLHSADEYREFLPRFGLAPRRVDVVKRHMKHLGRAGLEGWVRTTWFPYLNRVSETERQRFLTHFLDDYLSRFPIDAEGYAHVAMVSLEVEARRVA